MSLTAWPFPRDGQSPLCYVRMLAQTNGYSSIGHFNEQVWGRRVLKALELTEQDIFEAIGYRPEHTEKLRLLSAGRNTLHHQYGLLSIPRHQLVRQEMYCPNCLRERGYLLAKWQIGWLPMCLKHQRPLIPLCAEQESLLFNECEPKVPPQERRYYDLFGHNDVCEIQAHLERQLEDESRQGTSGDSIIDVVDQYLLASLRLGDVEQLEMRKRRYALRYYPFKANDSIKFLHCFSSFDKAA